MKSLIGSLEEFHIVNSLNEKLQNWYSEFLVDQLSTDELNNLVADANRLMDSLDSADGEVDSHEKRIAKFDEWNYIIDTASEIKNFVEEFNRKFGTAFNYDKEGIEQILNYSMLMMSVGFLSTDWLKDKKLPEVTTQAQAMNELIEKIISIRDEICSALKLKMLQKQISNLVKTIEEQQEDVLCMFDDTKENVTDIKENLQNKITEIENWNNKLMKQDIDLCQVADGYTRRNYINELQFVVSQISDMMQIIQSINETFGTEFSCTEQGIEEISGFMKMMLVPYHFGAEWLEINILCMIRNHISKMQVLSQRILTLHDQLSSEWNNEFLTYEYADVLVRFKTDY